MIKPIFQLSMKICYSASVENIHSLWTQTSTPNFGNCYTFNSAFNEADAESPRSSSLTGATSGN